MCRAEAAVIESRADKQSKTTHSLAPWTSASRRDTAQFASALQLIKPQALDVAVITREPKAVCLYYGQ